jgi:hypothetical protein
VVWVRFNNGSAGEVNLADALTGPVFEPLRDVRAFRRFRVDPDLATIVWENGADLAPEYLRDRLRPERRGHRPPRERVGAKG